ncbi:hypothetical protein [Flavobacterium sp.]|uniref:hypothetical protein n=1 Tax=Flavobacterium sp. TaxID=239 RepID=UPI00262A0624|nr:hypothetical protein [Flavobacterium sp.]
MDYSKYSDDELIDSYSTMLDYSGKANPEIIDEIEERGGLESFLKQKELKEKNRKEVGRISKEVHDACKNYVGVDLDFVKQSITSNVLSREDLDYLIERKFIEHTATITDKEINSNTIIGSIVGILIGSVLGSIFLIICIAVFNSIVYFPLIGVYIISYQTIKFITKKSRNNAVVFIASFIATILAMLIAIFASKLFI